MLTAIDLPEAAPPTKVELTTLEPPPTGVLRWIDIQAPTKDVLESMRVPFGLHPLAIEDCLTFEQRPKLEEYPGHLFVVIHELSRSNGELVAQELHAFLGQNFLVTVHAEACERVAQVMRRVLADRSLYARGVGFVY